MKNLRFLVFAIIVSFAVNPAFATTAKAMRDSGPEDGKYDFSAVLFNGGLEKIASDWPKIFASGTPYLIRKNNGEKTLLKEVNQRGRVIIIPPYVLTLNHIVDINKFEDLVKTPYGLAMVQSPADGVLNESYWLQESRAGAKISLKKIAFMPEHDLALFKMPQNNAISLKPLTMGRSSELKLGNLIFVLGSPRLIGLYIRSGIVSALGHHFDQEVMKDVPGSDLIPKGVIGISVPVMGGDSGSPVLALRDGKPELVGITQASLFEVLSVMIPIDMAFEKIEKAIGIDLRLQNEINLKNIKNKGGPK